MSDIPNRQDWNFGSYNSYLGLSYDLNKEKIQDIYIKKFINKTQMMFEYKNLPPTIPQKDLELLLQCNGNATITKASDGNLYAFRGGLGGTPNAYYLPTKSIIANPHLNFFTTGTIDKDCVVILNDAMYQGIMPLIVHASSLLAECDVSFKFACINIRIPAIIDAPDDIAKEEAELFFEQVVKGDKIGVIGSKAVLDRISVYDYASKDTSITHLIELKQYIIGNFYQELGIRSPFNMKREAINEAEATMSEDILYPLCDEMLLQRQIGIDKINKMYGTNIEVDFSSVWKKTREKRELEFELKESEITENNESGDEKNEQSE